jgi:hypothetical protein
MHDIDEPDDLFDPAETLPSNVIKLSAEHLDHTPLTFGKHKGTTPSDLALKDPGWLTWAYKNVTNKAVCSELLYKDCLKSPLLNRN